MSKPWWIGLEGWVLQDGNYTDFVTGERRQFALEFGYARTKQLERSISHEQPRVRYTGRNTQDEVAGQLVRSATDPMEDAFVLSFGLLAYNDWMVLDNLEPPVAGDWLIGEIYLNVDPFEYMDEPAQRPGMPSLIYTWTIDEIQLDTTPPMRIEYGHPPYVGPDEGPILVGDPSRESWRTITRTRLWDDDGSYTLRCSLENTEPTSSMAASGSRSPYGPLRSR